jgi:hypothetical protein
LTQEENFWRAAHERRIKIAMNTTGRKTVKAKASAPKSAKASNMSMKAGGAPTFESIAKRSYELYLARGAQPGHEVEDWLAAEAELSTRSFS